MRNIISEDDIEKATIKILTETYGYRHINCFTNEREDLDDKSNRNTKEDVVFNDILKKSLINLNPDISEKILNEALEQLLAHRSIMSPILANKEIYHLIRDGIAIEYDNALGKKDRVLIKVIDFKTPEKNDFCVVNQLWIKGKSSRRPDIIIYINGLPLVFIELKNSTIKVQNAYDDNLITYKDHIPLLFNYNVFCVLSNAVETKVGSFTSGYEHFFTWLRADDETEKIDRKAIQNEGTSLEALIHGVFPKARLLDYIENFILFYKGNFKIIAQNHQFIGVNKAIESFKDREERKGKLGVFWHTQGSGKSFSMIFLARKIFNKFTGNYTFVIITDREDLDGQIYTNFLDTNTVTKEESARPKDSSELRDFLGRNKRLIFTLIQKFRFDKGKEYPVLSDRNDIIVIVDEAHRTQYAGLADNMRKGLPNAQYFAFTGTPILGKGANLYKGKTYDWFGGYISQYNFSQSVDDGATVPLFYNKRVPEVLMQNENLSDEFYEIIENEDELNQEKFEKTFSTELEIITRHSRLETIAQDIVKHFPERGYLGKAMVISIDKYTCVKMYNQVQIYWKEAIRKLVGDIRSNTNPNIKKSLQKKLDYMRSIEMAVIISEEAGEEERFSKKGLDIKPHRKKIHDLDSNGKDIEARFKAPENKLQLVFVCAMWLTGFDAPTVSTLYLDKPMKDHTLMQTIARANRVTSYTIDGVNKTNGEIVDYYNVFRNMKQALSNYALGDDNRESDSVQDKANLFDLLDEAILQGKIYCESLGINLESVLDAKDIFKNINLFDSFANKLLEKDTYWKEFKVYENTISGLHEACKPEILRGKFRPLVPIFEYLRGVVESYQGDVDFDEIKEKISELLDFSVVTTNNQQHKTMEYIAEYKIENKSKILDLSKINFDNLKKEFKQKEFKNIEITNLREFIAKKLELMIKENSTRIDFSERFQKVIDRYNSGGMVTENYFEELVRFAESMQEESERHTREGLSEDELELFDVLKKEKMTKEEEIKVKNAAKHLLKRLKEEQPKVLIQDWFKDTQSMKKVETAIETVLDKDLPESYSIAIFKEKTQKIFQLIFEYASNNTKWVA